MAAGVSLKNIMRNEHGRMIHADISFTVDRATMRRLRANMQAAQETIDNATVRYLMAYVPLKSGTLQKSIPLSTKPGTGEVVVGTPYGHYQNFLDMPYKTIPANDPRYAGDPNRGSHFVERVIEDHGQDIIDEAQAVVDKGL